MRSKIISHGSDDQKTFVKTFRQPTNRHPAWEVWSDFIEMFATTLSNTFDKGHFEKRENSIWRSSGNTKKMSKRFFLNCWLRL